MDPKEVCAKCGECCKNLYWSDRIKISFHTKKLVLNKTCKLYDKNSGCKIYEKRPEVCRQFTCGIFKIDISKL